VLLHAAQGAVPTLEDAEGKGSVLEDAEGKEGGSGGGGVGWMCAATDARRASQGVGARCGGKVWGQGAGARCGGKVRRAERKQLCTQPSGSSTLTR
jgi:hypothetical protein